MKKKYFGGLVLAFLLLGALIFWGFDVKEETAGEQKVPAPELNVSREMQPQKNVSKYFISINATEKVFRNDVFAAQITYNLSNSSSLTLHDSMSGSTWNVKIDAPQGKIGFVFLVNGSGKNSTFRAESNEEHIGAEIKYKVEEGKQEINTFIIESWALMNREIASTLKPNDSAGVTVKEIGKSFTIILTEKELKVEEGLKNPDLIFIIYREEDLKEFAASQELGKTLKRMLREKKLAIQLSTGDMFKLARFMELAVKLGVAE